MEELSALLFLLGGFAISGYLGYLLFTGFFDLFTGYKKGHDLCEPDTCVDNSIHYHQHLTVIHSDKVLKESRTIENAKSRD